MWPRIDNLRVLELGSPGPLRAELNALVLAGRKKATAGHLEADYRAEGEELEHIGEHLVLVDDVGGRVGEVEVVGLLVMPFAAVPWEFAEAEGEGFRSIEHWREVHHRFWTGEGHEVDDDTEIVCIHLRLVTP
ncbi:ASCH domain-containing protein [Nonomuraea typhae]|uniref:ASCH domain-containing protein n=1 Tax=Nonomuraea typhae TaxID=2603600 RepID=A0ABW7YRM2_9ACTN